MRTRGWSHWLYLAPALLVLGSYLVYPTLVTLYLSFFDARSAQYIGLQNYARIFTQEETLIALRNNLLWIIVVPALTVSLGLLMAVVFDRVRHEALAKSAIFLPMAISFVGAGVIWKFVYAYTPPIYPQIGILNAIRTALGFDPIGWLIRSPWVNNLALMAVFIWIWAGYCMIILSAAYKGIHRDLLDAARTDGANEWEIFWHVALPMLRPTILVVATTMTVFTLKVFDIIYVLTNGNFGTEVLADRMYKEMFHFHNFGAASAIAVIILLAMLPVIVINVRRFYAKEGR
ncbi:MAG: ABC transporter [Candidatus Fraserbacteria bacterium RBG_16_55_9]|uniref:ABC transporter n=1 Tax=Fraserbacteria sp. (strain RBG_16_55_9) TaxID=1817864 RepID=A0A1F5UVB3_FRAXR|nr:MAG: ABC transporter [Candidatus Fraserbacteria bacterium RBG_16_55_9]